MVHLVPLFALLAATALTLPGGAGAHPGGDDAARELVARAAFLQRLGPRAANACQHRLQRRGVAGRLAEKRDAAVRALRETRGLSAHAPFLQARDLRTVLATDHHYPGADITPASTSEAIFAGINETVLAPDTTEGPYYVAGELIRSDVTDGEPGVPLALHIQMIDVNTCDPLPDLAVEIWHCNATGVYGGVEAGARGNGNPSDPTLLQKRALRGIQISDRDGVVAFDSIFPGHYAGRATHIHLMSHVNAQTTPGKTIAGGTVAHVGQLYFDQDLIAQVTRVPPYASNTVRLTQNANDMILRGGTGNNHDPVVEYIFVGDRVADGVFAWLTVGIDPGNARRVNAAASCTEAGCTSNGKGKGSGGLGGLGGLFGGLGGLGGRFGNA